MEIASVTTTKAVARSGVAASPPSRFIANPGPKMRANTAIIFQSAQHIAAAKFAEGKFPISLFEFLAVSEPLNPITLAQPTAEGKRVAEAKTGYADADEIAGDVVPAEGEVTPETLPPA